MDFVGFSKKQVQKKFKDSVSATHYVTAEVSINQPMQKPLVRATLKPLTGHLWPAGRVLYAPEIEHVFLSVVQVVTLVCKDFDSCC